MRSLKPARTADVAWVSPSLRDDMYRLNCRSLMCLLGNSLSPTIAEERLMPAPKTGHPNRRQAAILIVVTHLPSRLSDAHRTALDRKRGGVGWYPRSFFLHIDTGPVRSWEVFGRDLNNLFAPGVRGRLRTVADRMRLHRAIARRRLSAGH